MWRTLAHDVPSLIGSALKFPRPDAFRFVFSIVAIVMAVDCIVLLITLWNTGVVAFLQELIPLSLRFSILNIASVVGSYLVFVWLVSLAKRLRKKDTRVFVSFQHKYEHKAREVAASIAKFGLEPDILAFEPRDHDDVIDLVAQQTLTRRMTNSMLEQTLSSMADRSQIVASLWTSNQQKPTNSLPGSTANC